MQEIWKSLKDIVECGQNYEVSNMGRVRSLDKMVFNGKSEFLKAGRILKTTKNKSGYIQVTLSYDGKKKVPYVHRLVAMAFVENLKDLPEVNHEDGNKENNHSDNLKWVNSSDNKKHAYANGLMKPMLQKGINNKNSKLNNNDIIFIRENYKPYDKEFSARGLSKRFNVSESLIHKIVREENWTHV